MRAPDAVLDLPPGLPMDHIVRYLARDLEGTTERLTEDGFSLGQWLGEVPTRIDVKLDEEVLRAEIRVSSPDADPELAVQRVARLLGLEADPRAFEEHVRRLGLGRLIEGREGARIPQTPVPFDGLVWSIVGQQVTVSFAVTLRRRLSELLGEPLEGGLVTAPRPQDVAALEPEALLPLQFSRRKAEYVIGAAQEIVEGRLDLVGLAKRPSEETEATLIALRGIGPWSANYLMLRALNAPDCVPLGDTGLTSALARFFDVPRPGPKETLELMEPFRPYRSLATYHLWHWNG